MNAETPKTPDTELCKCPSCETLLDGESLRHDGYEGSPYAHGGQGSYGFARHHYFFVCECGWAEDGYKQALAEKKNRKKASTVGRGSQTLDGFKFGPNASPHEKHVQLSCWSRLTRYERALVKAAEAAGLLGCCCGHSTCASYYYDLVPLRFVHRETRPFSGVLANYVSPT